MFAPIECGLAGEDEVDEKPRGGVSGDDGDSVESGLYASGGGGRVSVGSDVLVRVLLASQAIVRG